MTISLVSNNKLSWIDQLITDEVISTPALVIDSLEVDRILKYFEKYIPEVKLFYAVKANNASPLLSYLNQKGLSFDVASAKEISELRGIGIAPNRMILSNPVKSPATINSFFDQGLRLVTIDNPLDLEALSQARNRTGNTKPVDVFVRVRIPTTDVQIDLNSKFGCDEDEAILLLKQVADYGFRPRGIQFHVGTQSWNAKNFGIGINVALRVIDEMQNSFGIKCDSINMGGGYPDPNVAREAGGLDVFFAQLAECLKPAIKRGLNIIAEPGRIVASSACSSVCSIIGKSIRNGTPWIYLDDGAYGLFSGKFFDHKEFDFTVLKKQLKSADSHMVPHVVAGPTCDSLDVISQPVLLPSDLTNGDTLVTHNMGAYSLTTGNLFNGFGHIHTYLGRSDEFFVKIRPTRVRTPKVAGL